MGITSPLYFVFVFLIMSVFWLAPKRTRIFILLGASYIWYASLDLFYLPLLLGTTLVDFFIGKQLDQPQRSADQRKVILLFSLAANLGILLYFKISPLQAPIGVSFYTFHSLSYVFDVYYRKQPAETSFAKYSLFVSFFPKLLAGPIERYRDFNDKLSRENSFSLLRLYEGIAYVIFGLYLKIVIGDSLALLAGKTFDGPATTDSWKILLGTYAYSAQIYADFFGYTLIARGVALGFGITLDPNFLSPYLATSPKDFWRRWHRSLSFWFRDYLYIPLGGNRSQWIRNVAATMILAGAWHGASIKFLAWGAYHAFFLILSTAIENFFKGRFAAANSTQQVILRILSWFFTLQVSCLGWIFFRANSTQAAFGYFQALISWNSSEGLNQSDLLFLLLFLSPWIAFRLLQNVFITSQKENGTDYALGFYALSAGLSLVGIFLFGGSVGVPFIYLKF